MVPRTLPVRAAGAPVGGAGAGAAAARIGAAGVVVGAAAGTAAVATTGTGASSSRRPAQALELGLLLAAIPSEGLEARAGAG